MMSENSFKMLDENVYSPETWVQRVLHIIESVQPELLDRFAGPYVYSVTVIKPVHFDLDCALPFQIDRAWVSAIRAGHLTHGFLYNTNPAIVEFVLRLYIARAEVLEWAFRDFDSSYMTRRLVKGNAP